MRVLVIDGASPEHAGLRRLLEGADPGPGRVADTAAELLALLASRRPGELVVVQTDPEPDVRRSICVRVRGSLQQVPVGEVRYFLAEHKYVWARTAQTRLLIRDSLQALAQEFAGGFVRIHRNALVATRYLHALVATGGGRCHVRMAGIDETLPVSRRRIAALRQLVRLGQDFG